MPADLQAEVAVAVELVSARFPLAPDEGAQLLALLSRVTPPLDDEEFETLRPFFAAGVKAVPVLEQALRDEKASLRVSALVALTLLMPSPARHDNALVLEAVTVLAPLVLRSSFDPDSEVRRRSIIAIGRIGRSVPSHCQARLMVALRRMLHDPDQTVVNNAAGLLFEVGLTEGIPPELLKLLQTQRPAE